MLLLIPVITDHRVAWVFREIIINGNKSESDTQTLDVQFIISLYADSISSSIEILYMRRHKLYAFIGYVTRI